MIGKANLSDLQGINLQQSTPIHPQWIEKQHPELTKPMHHPLTSVDEFDHRGNSVRITTTYKIEINGREVMPHASISQQGHFSCHSTPYTPYHYCPVNDSRAGGN